MARLILFVMMTESYTGPPEYFMCGMALMCSLIDAGSQEWQSTISCIIKWDCRGHWVAPYSNTQLESQILKIVHALLYLFILYVYILYDIIFYSFTLKTRQEIKERMKERPL